MPPTAQQNWLTISQLLEIESITNMLKSKAHFNVRLISFLLEWTFEILFICG